jgi:membrane protein implicated in regulation of membrane protease activity
MTELFSDIEPFWFWLGLACLLLAMEALIVPTGFFLCLGTGAAVVALVAFLFPDIGWLWALTLFAVLTVIASGVWWALVRERFSKPSSEEPALNLKTKQLVGYEGVVSEAVRNGRGKMRVNDSPWMVEADEDYPAGTRVVVVAVKGITLQVRALEK